MDPAAKPVRRARIFISYRRADSAGRARRLKDDLTRLRGDRVFMDVADIAPGADFETVLRNELASCGVVLAVIGAGWRKVFDTPREGLDYVRLELGQALAQAGVQVIPVLMQGASLPDADRLPDDLRALCKRQAIAIRDDRWQDDIAYLARELRTTFKLSRLPLRWIAAGVLALAAPAAWYALHRPQPPAAFSRTRAHEITTAATAKRRRHASPRQSERLCVRWSSSSIRAARRATCTSPPAPVFSRLHHSASTSWPNSPKCAFHPSTTPTKSKSD